MESVLDRYLLPTEVVDHKDGLTLHNQPDNLRLFSSNGEHLAATIGGMIPKWSEAGQQNIGVRQPQEYQSVDMYRQRKALGEIRLRQILLAALQLGIDSPFLFGTRHHLEKAGISEYHRSTIERALADLYSKWGVGHAL